MGTRRESMIYLLLAIAGVVITAYVVDKLVVLTLRPHSSTVDVALLGAVATIFVVLTTFYAIMAFVFATRFIGRVKRDAGSVLLYRHDGTPVSVNGGLRVIRRFGSQLSSNQNQPVFALFIANGQLWVSPHQEMQDGV